MNRRTFLRTAGLVSAGIALEPAMPLVAAGEASSRWRSFEVTTRIEVSKPSGVTRIWVPVPMTAGTPYQKTLGTTFTAAGGTARLVEVSALDALSIVAAEFPANVRPVLVVSSRVSTRNFTVDLTAPGTAPPANAAALEHFLRPTRLLPTDGIVRDTATRITLSASTDVEKARAIYEWIVENTRRRSDSRGCGLGDIRFMLESKDLAGKCADLNALYVGLCRAAGIPARDVYGIRTLKSDLGYRSLGAASSTITKAQHCRAEVHLDGYGWVPVDPADVRKVVLEEPPGTLTLDDELVVAARTRLFGSWEMNWMAYNFAHDVALPASGRSPVPFLMYPQAETAEGWLDSLEPDNFTYEITANEIADVGHAR